MSCKDESDNFWRWRAYYAVNDMKNSRRTPLARQVNPICSRRQPRTYYVVEAPFLRIAQPSPMYSYELVIFTN